MLYDSGSLFWYFYYKKLAERERQEKIKRGEILEA